MNLLSPNFFIGSISIGIVEDASCVNIGNNYPMDFQSHKKQNQGFGTVTGNGNQMDGIRTLLNDAAMFDFLSGQKDFTVPPWLQQLIQERLREEGDEVVFKGE